MNKNINQKKWKGISLTQTAYKKIKNLIKKHQNIKGIQINIKKSGCAGFRYYLSLIYLETQINKKNFYIYQNQDAKIYIKNENMKLIDGTKIDFVESDGINMSFKFNNPQAKESCGCGESFNIIPK
ncbi:iron-sulfur cluster assembly accessory protein [Buchnera aphidicola]|uniref:iron-sulfur cluster assembly accessory protein n=1 Tax=Buchnera aphidicola TaxID=9 RepID=UPI003463D6D2